MHPPVRQAFLIVAIILFIIGGVWGAWAPAPNNWNWSGRIVSLGLAFFAASFY